MSSHLPYPKEEHRARLMAGDPVADAYEWLQRYVDGELNRMIQDQYDPEDCYNKTPVTLDEVIECVLSNQGDQVWGDYISRGGAFEGYHPERLFWEKVRIFLQKPQIEEVHFFSCSC